MRFCIAMGAKLVPTIPVALGGDFVKQMKIASNLGFQGVELHSPSSSLIDVSAVKQAMAQDHLKVETIGTGPIWGKFGLSIMDQDPIRLSVLIEMVKKYIDVASEIGSKITIGSIKGNIPSTMTYEQGISYGAKSYQELDNYAGHKGVTILLEATNRYENNYFNRGQEVYDFIEKYGLNHTQILLDAFHANIEESDFSHCVKPLMNHLGHIHFADNNRHWPGSGCLNLEGFTEQIRNAGYDGVVSIECLPWPDSMTAAQNSLEFFHRHFHN